MPLDLSQSQLLVIIASIVITGFMGWMLGQKQQKKRLKQLLDTLKNTQFTRQILPLNDDQNDEIGQLNQQLVQIQSHVQNEIAILKNQTKELTELVQIDPITHLKNRSQLSEILKQVINRTNRGRYCSALLFIDINRFKEINDSFGYEIGDKLLELIAQRLQRKIRKTDFLFRFEGDDFVIIYDHIGDFVYQAQDQVEKLSQYLVNELSKPYHLNHREYHLKFAIGAEIITTQEESEFSNIMQHAEVALSYLKQKASDNSQVVIFQPSMLEEVHYYQLLEEALKHALEKDEIYWLVQPQINMQTHEIVGGEVLMRWQHNGKIISPVEFIPLAENTGLIVPMTYWMIKSVFIYLIKHQNQLKNKVFAINLSPVLFNDNHFMKNIHGLFSRHEIDPQQIKFEITEGVFLENIDHIRDIMQQLKALGCQISLDDFGTGFSSLNYLKTLPIDQLKIDKSFLHQLLTDDKSSAIIKTIIDLSQNLQINVIAEGIEYPEQAQFLIENNCLLCQGFLYAKPLDKENFLTFSAEPLKTA